MDAVLTLTTETQPKPPPPPRPASLRCGKSANFTQYDDLSGIANRHTHPIRPEPEVHIISHTINTTITQMMLTFFIGCLSVYEAQGRRNAEKVRRRLAGTPSAQGAARQSKQRPTVQSAGQLLAHQGRHDPRNRVLSQSSGRTAGECGRAAEYGAGAVPPTVSGRCDSVGEKVSV